MDTQLRQQRGGGGAEGKVEGRKEGRGVVAIKPPCRAPPLLDLMKTIIDWGRGETSRRRSRSRRRRRRNRRRRTMTLGWGRGQWDTDLLLYKFFNKLNVPAPPACPSPTCPPACLEVSGINDGDLPLIESSNRGEAGGQGQRGLTVG